MKNLYARFVLWLIRPALDLQQANENAATLRRLDAFDAEMARSIGRPTASASQPESVLKVSDFAISDRDLAEMSSRRFRDDEVLSVFALRGRAAAES